MAVPERRIVLLGKTGVGKSSLGNTIFGKQVFKALLSPKSITSKCQSETSEVHGRKITVIDTPGLFDTNKCEDDLKSELAKCVTLSAPGVHAFVIVLKLERFTQQEKEVISKIKKSFSKEALKYAVIVFTHGDQLEDQKIEDFVKENHDLRDLVKECGGRCHMIDNKYWDKERNNEEVKKLLNTIDKMVEQNNGEMYTNEMLEQVHSMLQKVKNIIRGIGRKMSESEILKRAQSFVSNALKITIGSVLLLNALLGVTIIGALYTFKSFENYLDELEVNRLKYVRNVSVVFGSGADEDFAELTPTEIKGATISATVVRLFGAAGISCVIETTEGGSTGCIKQTQLKKQQ